MAERVQEINLTVVQWQKIFTKMKLKGQQCNAKRESGMESHLSHEILDKKGYSIKERTECREKVKINYKLLSLDGITAA